MIYIVKERLCLTEDNRLVPEGHPDGRWLYAIPGAEIPPGLAEKYGLVQPEQAEEPEQEPEQAKRKSKKV